MSNVYQVTITDHADFSRVVHESFWAEQHEAERYGNDTLKFFRDSAEPEYRNALELVIVGHTVRRM